MNCRLHLVGDVTILHSVTKSPEKTKTKTKTKVRSGGVHPIVRHRAKYYEKEPTIN